MTELLVADRMLIRPVEFDRADDLIESVHLARGIPGRKLGAVAAVVEEQAVAGLDAAQEPAEPLPDAVPGRASVGEETNLAFLEMAAIDEDIGHVDDVVHAAPERGVRIGVDPDQERSVHGVGLLFTAAVESMGGNVHGPRASPPHMGNPVDETDA